MRFLERSWNFSWQVLEKWGNFDAEKD